MTTSRGTDCEIARFESSVLNFGAEAYQANLRSEDKEELSVSFTKAWNREFCEQASIFVLARACVCLRRNQELTDLLLASDRSLSPLKPPPSS